MAGTIIVVEAAVSDMIGALIHIQAAKASPLNN